MPNAPTSDFWLANLTVAARLAVAISFLVSLAGNIAFAMGSLPPGRYPVIMIAVPIAVAFLILTALSLCVLRGLGVRIVRRNESTDRST